MFRKPLLTSSSVLFLVGSSLGQIAPEAVAQPAQGGSNLSSDKSQSEASQVSCEQLKAGFRPDANTEVRLARLFRKGDDINLDGTPTGHKAPAELCLVKLRIGPGNSGPENAPSTSKGIGVEVWLPARENWTGRVHQLGTGGFAGNPDISSLTKMVGFAGISQGALVAMEGSIAAVSDDGHVSQQDVGGMYGSFAMNPDGTINTTLWNDFANRGIHEAALKVRALAEAFYGRSVTKAYFDGCSGGGREALSEAQNFPTDFDGILSGAPGINWTRALTGDIYAQVVMQRDLGGKLITPVQLDFVSAHAVSACDSVLTGEHDGFITDAAQCRYDPRKDPDVLCKSSGGKNETNACVTTKEATAIDKIWYGETVDGGVPDPKGSNGFSAKLKPGQVWFGIPRGAPLTSTKSFPVTNGVAYSEGNVAMPFDIATEQLALDLQNPKMSMPTFHNATANGADGWKSLSYAELAHAQAEGMRLQSQFGHVNTDNPDLHGLQDHKAKLIMFQGVSDEVLPIQGAINYYENVASKMGGYSRLQTYFRFYPVPGMNHCGVFNPVNGVDGVSPLARERVPAFPNLHAELFAALVDWVEKGTEPSNLTVSNADKTRLRPLCAYPAMLKYQGGDRAAATSYVCR